MRQENNHGFQGTLYGITPADIIQLNCLNNANTILIINNDDKTGKIYIKNGAVVHSTTSDLKGEEAFFKIMSWTTGNFTSHKFDVDVETTITRHWKYLVLEAVRINDEIKKTDTNDFKIDQEVVSAKKPVKIMIIDDSAVMLSIIKRNLSIFPDIQIVAEAQTGKEALQKLVETDIDVILLDLTFPEIDGVDLLKKILLKKKLPVLMMSALSEFNQDRVFEALHLGALGFIQKPKKDKNISLSNRFIQMRLTIKDLASFPKDEIKKIPLQDRNEKKILPIRKEPADRIIIIFSNITHYYELISTIRDLPTDLKNIAVVIYHPFPSQLNEAFTRFLKNYLAYPITYIDDSTFRNNKNKITPIYKSNLYILPPERDIAIVEENSVFDIQLLEKKLLESSSVFHSLLKNLKNNGMDFKIHHCAKPFTSDCDIMNLKEKVIILNFGFNEKDVDGKNIHKCISFQDDGI